MFPQNPAENWLQKNIDTQNAAAQTKANADLAKYKTQLAEWKESTVQARYNNAAIPAPPALPTITVYFDAGGWINSKIQVNSYAEPPALPPMPTVTAPNTGIGTSAGERDAEMFRLLNAILAEVKK